jgi:protein O-mannosyl-transferase
VARKPPARRADRRAPARWLLLLPALLAVAVYLPSLGHPFVWDDLAYIARNPAAQRVGELGSALGHGYGWSPLGSDRADSYLYFRPLVVVANNLQWALSGGAPWFFHLFNLLAHALCVGLLVRLAWRLGLPALAAAWLGAIFAVHPAFSEAVFWVSGRTDLLAALFGLLALVLVAEWRIEPRESRRANLAAAAAGALLLALASKESALAFVVVAPLLALLPVPAGGRRGLLAAIAVAVVVYLAARLLVMGPGPGRAVAQGALVLPDRGDLGERLLLGGSLFLTYLLRLVVPWPLAIDGPAALGRPPYPVVTGVAGSLVLLAAIALWARTAVRAARRLPVPAWASRPAALCGVALFLFGLLPVLQWVPSGEIYGERFLYIPAAGLLLLAGSLAGDWLAARRARAGLALAAIGVPFLVLLQLQSPVWANELALFRHSVAVHPASARAQANLGGALMDRGDFTGAEPYLQRAAALDARDWRVQAQYGSLLINLGRVDDGVARLERIRAAGRRDPTLFTNLGIGWIRQGKYDQAAGILAEAERLSPNDPAVLDSRAMAERKRGNFAEAERLWARTIALDPGRKVAYLNLIGMDLTERRDWAAARPWAERFVARFPTAPEATQIRQLLREGAAAGR